MTETSGARPDTVGQTPWSSRLTLPLRAFQRAETASAGVLAGAIGVALVWANLGPGYENLWSTELSLRLGDLAIEQDLREWVNSGLMTLFFLVVGLEARREFDLGELRDRKRFLVPLVAGVLGMLLPVLLYLAVTRGTDAASGWGVAMSTDTALALGFLSVLGRAVPGRVRVSTPRARWAPRPGACSPRSPCRAPSPISSRACAAACRPASSPFSPPS